jgi:hypothetical protein
MDPVLKRQRPRGASISGRLRSASDLCDDGVISQQEKGLLKDMIIVGNAQLDAAFAAYERGNVTPLKGSTLFCGRFCVISYSSGVFSCITCLCLSGRSCFPHQLLLATKPKVTALWVSRLCVRRSVGAWCWHRLRTRCCQEESRHRLVEHGRGR